MLGSLLVLALVSTPPAPSVAVLRRELDAVAARIEELKVRRAGGAPVEGELEALLVRAQDLADALERARPRPAAPAVTDPDRTLADELRGRAAELREEAERLAAAIAEVDAQIHEALWGGAGQGAVSPIAPRSPRVQVAANVSEVRSVPDLRRLVEQRGRLAAAARALGVQASRLDEAADALERRR